MIQVKRKQPVAIIVGTATKFEGEGDPSEFHPAVRWGLGGALALRFSEGGFQLALMGRRQAVLEDIAAEIKAQGGTATPIVCDVAEDASVEAAFKVAKELGPVEVLVFNVAPPYPANTSFANLPTTYEVDPNYLTAAFNIGVTGCVRCCQ